MLYGRQGPWQRNTKPKAVDVTAESLAYELTYVGFLITPECNSQLLDFALEKLSGRQFGVSWSWKSLCSSQSGHQGECYPENGVTQPNPLPGILTKMKYLCPEILIQQSSVPSCRSPFLPALCSPFTSRATAFMAAEAFLLEIHGVSQAVLWVDHAIFKSTLLVQN